MNAIKAILLASVVMGVMVVASEGSHSGAAGNAPTGIATKWAHLRVVAYASGLTGFFDTSNGRLYLYRSDLKTPYMTAELHELGKPMKIINGWTEPPKKEQQRDETAAPNSLPPSTEVIHLSPL